MEINKVWDSRCLRAEPDGVWPTFGFPGESTASCPGSCTAPPRPATARQGVTFCILSERNSPKHTKLDNVKQTKKNAHFMSHQINSKLLTRKEACDFLPGCIVNAGLSPAGVGDTPWSPEPTWWPRLCGRPAAAAPVYSNAPPRPAPWSTERDGPLFFTITK